MTNYLREVELAYVFKGDILAGTLKRTARGSQFTYDENYLSKISVARDQVSRDRASIAYTINLSSHPVTTTGLNVHPYFAGLLPEGLRLAVLFRILKTSQDDLFTLLVAVGGDCIGDTRIGTNPNKPPSGGDVLLDDQEVDFRALFKKSVELTPGMEDVLEQSVPGVQDKLSGHMLSLSVKYIKRNREYILKLSPKGYPLLVENENFFTGMAQSCGLKTSKTTLVKDTRGEAGLLIERFDRAFDRSIKKMVRIHQEDGCQFLNIYPTDKYRIALSDIAKGIQKYSSTPELDVGGLVKMVAFSYLIGNGDLHARNISLFTAPVDGRVSLTPGYDILSTAPYGDMKMALRFEGRDDNITARDFINFGKRFGMPEKATLRILNEILDNSTPWITRLEEIGFTKKKTGSLRSLIKKRQRDLE